MKWELAVSLKYLLSKRKEKFISITTILSVVSVMVGVAALIIVLAVMNGFGDKLRQKIVGFNYHIQVEKIGGIKSPDDVVSSLKRFDSIKSATPFVDGQASAYRRKPTPWSTGARDAPCAKREPA